MSIGRQFFVAYLWNMFGKLFIRGMGVISTLLLVRILSPEDFGVIAIATMFIGFFEVLSNAGINRYLILHEAPDEQLYNSAWTLNLILRFFALILNLIIAPVIADYMQNPELVFVVQAIAVTGFMGAFTSIGLIKLERAVNFAPVNKINIIAKVFATTATIIAAIYYRSYYALLIGNFVLTFLSVVASYTVTKHFPKFDFNFDRNIFKFSLQLLLRNIAGYSRSQIDVLLIGKKFDGASLGAFTIARQFAIMPQTEIVAPAMQPAFSLLSGLKKNRDVFFEKVYQSLFLIYLFVVPAAIGLQVLAKPFVMAILGDKWISAADYIGLLAFLMLPFSTQTILHTIYDAFNKTKLSLFADLFGLIAIILLFFLVSPTSVENFSELRLLVGISALALSIILVKALISFSIKKYLAILSIPLLASLLMTVVLELCLHDMGMPIITLITFSFLGIISYLLSLALIFICTIIFKPTSWYLTLMPSITYRKINLYFPGWLTKMKLPPSFYKI